MRPVQSAIICSPVAEGCAAAGRIQLAALRITLQRIDNGEGGPSNTARCSSARVVCGLMPKKPARASGL